MFSNHPQPWMIVRQRSTFEEQKGVMRGPTNSESTSSNTSSSYATASEFIYFSYCASSFKGCLTLEWKLPCITKLSFSNGSCLTFSPNILSIPLRRMLCQCVTCYTRLPCSLPDATHYSLLLESSKSAHSVCPTSRRLPATLSHYHHMLALCLLLRYHIL